MFELSKFKKANAQFQGKGVFKCEGTFYHLTPNNLGEIVYLEPREPKVENFKSLCVANYLMGCLVAMPEEKQEQDTFFLYRNFQPCTAYREVLDSGLRLNEAKIFEKSKFIRIGKVHHCTKFFEELRQHGNIVYWNDEQVLQKFLRHLTIEKEKNTSIILVSYSNGKYTLA
ncbi:hypothetical protein ACI2U6_16415 [Ralstonia nicotianae]